MWDHVNRILNQAANRITTVMGDFLPGLVAFLVVLILSFVVAWIVRAILQRFLRSINFNRMPDRWGFFGLSEWSPSRSPTLLVGRLTYWIIVLLGVLLGISALDTKLTSQLVDRIFSYLANVLAAALVLIVGTVVARFLARGVLISAVNMQLHYARLLSLGVKWLILVLTGAVALEHLGIGGGIVRLSFGILFGGIVLALALAVGLGSKDMVSRSWERQAGKHEEATEEHFHHL